MMPDVSATALELYNSLAPTWTDQDESYGWPLLYFAEAICASGLQPVYDYAFDRDDRPGWTILLDLNETPDDAVAYLAQFAGVVADPGNTPQQNRDLISSRANWERGMPASIIASVQATLLGSKRVIFNERDTSAYHATIQTYEVQTPDPTATRAAIAASKPGGLIIDLAIISSATFAQVQAGITGGTFADRLAQFPTFADVLDYVP